MNTNSKLETRNAAVIAPPLHRMLTPASTRKAPQQAHRWQRHRRRANWWLRQATKPSLVTQTFLSAGRGDFPVSTPAQDTLLESTINPQAGKPALRPVVTPGLPLLFVFVSALGLQPLAFASTVPS